MSRSVILSPVIARWLLVACAILAGWIVFQPQPTLANDGIDRLAGILRDLQVPEQFTTRFRVGALLNMILFIPLAACAMLAFPRMRWTEITVAGFVISLAIEVSQGVLMAHRMAESIDIVTNTAGALLGALLVTVLQHSAPGDPSAERPHHS